MEENNFVCFKLLSLWEFFLQQQQESKTPFLLPFLSVSCAIRCCLQNQAPTVVRSAQIEWYVEFTFKFSPLPQQTGFYNMYTERPVTSVNPKSSLSLLHECKYIQSKVRCPFQNKLFLNFVFIELNSISLLESNIKFSLKFKNRGS